MRTTTRESAMSLNRAFAVARREPANPVQWTPEEERDWKAAEAVLIKAGYCPSCASDSEEPLRSKLGKWEPGDYWNYAGRACPNCEEFFVCGEQPEYEPDPWMGDADPGL